MDICAKDRASGVEVEHAFDADDVMSKEANADEKNSSVYIDLEEPSSATKKKLQFTRANKGKDREGMMNSMREVAESLKDFVQVSRKRMEGNAQEVVQEVLTEMEMITDIDEEQSYKAINWLIENPSKIPVLKALPSSKKKRYLLSSMS